MEEGSETPNSSIGKHASLKDKQCPFCRQSFTSSSLGRHLDLYIREKNPKPPDNVHDVDQIRKLRGSITRRQVRSSTKREGSTPSTTAKATSSQEERSPSVLKAYVNHSEAQDGAVKTYHHNPIWHATGVINDLPSASRNSPGNLDLLNPKVPVRESIGTEAVARAKQITGDGDRAQAAELALKEVLENIRVASARTSPASPFDFNLFGLSLTQMYLRCLAPPPQLLAQSHGFQQPHWSINPPSTEDYEVLRGWIDDKLHDWRRRQQNARYGDPYQATNGHSTPDDKTMNMEEASYHEHLAQEYRVWVKMSSSEREEQWHRECARAFAQEQEKHRETTRRLEQAEQELRLLRSHLTQFSAISQPSMAARYPPSPLPLSQDTLTHLPASQSPQTWDYDCLLDKWKTRIQSARSSQSFPLPPPASSPWHPPPPPAVHHQGANEIDRRQSLANASLPTPEGHDNTNAPEYHREEDLADAPGEDEEEEDGYGDDQPQQLEQEMQNKGSEVQQKKKNQDSVDGVAGRGNRRLMRLGMEDGGVDMDVDSG